jgi:hypothetical protein
MKNQTNISKTIVVCEYTIVQTKDNEFFVYDINQRVIFSIVNSDSGPIIEVATLLPTSILKAYHQIKMYEKVFELFLMRDVHELSALQQREWGTDFV